MNIKMQKNQWTVILAQCPNFLLSIVKKQMWLFFPEMSPQDMMSRDYMYEKLKENEMYIGLIESNIKGKNLKAKGQNSLVKETLSSN